MSLITRTPVLWGLFVLMIAAGAGFGFFSTAVGGQYLDMLSNPAEARALLAGLTPPQRSAHFWVTVLLDTAFPIAFGLLFAGLAWRFFGKWGPLAALPGFAVLIFDLTENTIQALALSGAVDVLDAKAWVTPMKMYLFYAAALIAVAAVLIALYRVLTKKKA
ncbi:MAG: hypothetical protein Q8L84_02470 [Hyphomonas sp.]|nr:hypothetical protein [Hyphomonas sp.]